jgi:hypothetical protein
VIETAWSARSLPDLQDRLKRTSPAAAAAIRRCANCGSPLKRRPSGGGFQGGCGYCRACFERWSDAERPDTGPPDPVPPGERNAAWRQQLTADKEQRLARFANLRARGRTVAVSARWAGVSEETGMKYAAELKRRRQEDETTEAVA